MVELLINGSPLDLPDKGNEIKYTKRISDIFSVSNVSVSFTNSFNVPKTATNTQIFEQLGLIGNNSSIPYSKVDATLKKDGIDIVRRGWLQVKESSDNYKVGIIDGMIDFFKAIENKTLGSDLNLSEFNHVKDFDTVINSMNPSSTLPYKYVVADYNGENHGFANGHYGINIDYLIPSFDCRRIMDIIFQTYGFTYDMADIPYLNNFFITYPLPPLQDPTEIHIAHFNRASFETRSYFEYSNGKVPTPFQSWTVADITEGELVEGRKFKVPATGGYRVKVSFDSYIEMFNNPVNLLWGAVFKNGLLVYAQHADPQATVSYTYDIQANEGDLIEVLLWYNYTGSNANWLNVHHLNMDVDIYKIDLGNVSLTNAFKDFKIKDFFKEILWRTGLTPVGDPYTRHIRFYPLSYRLDKSNVTDWTDKYIRRVKEIYQLNEYGQKNRFRLKHDNEQDSTGDGFLLVNNVNLTDEVILAESKIYAPELEVYEYPANTIGVAGFWTYKFRIWNREPKEDGESGNVVIDYKGLSNRFYFIRVGWSNLSDWQFVSSVLNEDLEVNQQIPFASINETLFDNAIDQNWQDYRKVMNNFKAHEIELALSVNDINSVDFLKPFYFKTENAYYMLNALNWQSGKTSTGEFIKINAE